LLVAHNINNISCRVSSSSQGSGSSPYIWTPHFSTGVADAMPMLMAPASCHFCRRPNTILRAIDRFGHRCGTEAGL